ASAVWLDQGRAQFRADEKVKKPEAPLAPATTPAADAGMNPDGFLNGGISLPKDEKNRGKAIEAAIDYINDDPPQWGTAIENLQKLLKIDEDVFVRLKRKNDEGKEVFVWVSAKQEADRLIGGLPTAGMAFYKATCAAQAAGMLRKAKQEGDPALLAQIVKLYAHTDAGSEAVKLLADYHLDRGNYSGALFCYARLL